MSCLVLGIDPGVNGGCAVFDARPAARIMPGVTSEMLLRLHKFDHQGHVAEILSDVIADAGQLNTVAYIEQVTGYIGKEQPGAHMFKFGENYGIWKGALAVLKIKTVYVPPLKWQLGLGLRKPGQLNYRKWKAYLRDCAQALGYGKHVSLDTADALLILEYGLRDLGLVQNRLKLTKPPKGGE